jgi:hypothetical protein
LVGTAATYDGASVDLNVAGNDPAPGAEVPVETLITGASAGTSLQALIIQADSADLQTNQDILESGTVDTVMAAGTRLGPHFIPLDKVTKRYIGVSIVSVGVGGGGAAVSSSIVWDRQTNDSDNAAATEFGATVDIYP